MWKSGSEGKVSLLGRAFRGPTTYVGPHSRRLGQRFRMLGTPRISTQGLTQSGAWGMASFFARLRTLAIATAHWHYSKSIARRCRFSGRENTRGGWWTLTLVVEGLCMLGEEAQAGQLCPLVRELIDTGQWWAGRSSVYPDDRGTRRSWRTPLGNRGRTFSHRRPAS